MFFLSSYMKWVKNPFYFYVFVETIFFFNFFFIFLSKSETHYHPTKWKTFKFIVKIGWTIFAFKFVYFFSSLPVLEVFQNFKTFFFHSFFLLGFVSFLFLNFQFKHTPLKRNYLNAKEKWRNEKNWMGREEKVKDEFWEVKVKTYGLSIDILFRIRDF